MSAIDYDIVVTRRLRNPVFKPHDGFSQDYRKPEERQEHLTTRTIQATLTDDEYELVKRALIEFWAARVEARG